mmetsp:Transcript_14126/g.34838  ORF Transcript_14126/g.34838 Transcript_14126/m.34838 type:complete len:551 (-) Transcript_14126:1063-2715(-)|eukprot:CAMPEP_0202866238 /NCGR_PEP_ID=MMETSP1391-20130828/7276_1 /ASSEMBLY_ACC=CAM_ASM_000867 /TAXON_ID=1034604 /ORGANISM="Chlamydomonas leiostraca, Strain SAG 11-49" /LENGTH=550 /DNA_ID=CAMNT_0049546171 /DNA_START=218 /DNA_END=1870 /DNA_ORIENTATION=-
MNPNAASFVPSFLSHAKPITIPQQQAHQPSLPKTPEREELNFEDAFEDTAHCDGVAHSPTSSAVSSTLDYRGSSCSRLASVEEEAEPACEEAAYEDCLAAGESTPAPGVAPAHAGSEDPNTVQRAQVEMERDISHVQQCTSHVPSMPAKVGPQDFEMLRVVGQGAFGKVFQVQHKATQHVYAMKVMKKERIMAKDHSEYVRAERDVLTSVVHPYIVNLRFSFQTPTRLYIVLDFINGGHLFFNLYRAGVFSEDVARLYTAEIVLAIGYLHSLGIAHRDLKPENVLLDSEGHVKLTDFGLAKPNMSNDGARSNSFIGTMEYMAPEIIDGKGHSKSVDWWSTGILLYEMLCGVPPFRAKSRNQLQQQILQGKVKYPKFLSSDALSLLKGLLARDPAKRLGHDGEATIKKHPFFKTINWAKLEKREVESKFKPEVTCARDIKNFDKLWTDQKPEESPCGTPTGAGLQNGTPTSSGCTKEDPFKGFTYVAPCFMENGIMAAMSGAAAAAATASAVCSAAAAPCATLAPATRRVLGFNVTPSPPPACATAKAGGA